MTTLDELASKFRDVQLATLVDEPPHTADWAYELKWDGHRIVALKSGSNVRLVSRNHQDWTRELEPIARAVAKLKERDIVLDGQACVLDASGKLVYFVFDLLLVGDDDLRDRPWSERRARLEALGPKKPLVLSAAFEVDPTRVLRSACDAGLEGIIAKRKSARYAGTRTKSWLEVKCVERDVVLGVRISNADRVLDPTGVTKIRLARYYEAIADKMLPHVRGRPLTLVRWAEGKRTEKGGVYLRHARAWGPPALRRVRIREKTKIGEYLVADTAEALVSLAQMDILEIHTWNATTDDIEHPDRIVFDLDPGPGVSWREITEAARHVRDRLKSVKLESWVKTTGGKGLHVVAPVERSASWNEWLAFSRELVRAVIRDAPDRYVMSMSKSVRRGRIYVDYLRNNRTSTSIAAFSIRAKPNAPVSVPVDWDELDEIDPASFTMDAVMRHFR